MDNPKIGVFFFADDAEYELKRGDVDIAIIETPPWDTPEAAGFCHIFVEDSLVADAIRSHPEEIRYLESVESNHPVFLVMGKNAECVVDTLRVIFPELTANMRPHYSKTLGIKKEG